MATQAPAEAADLVLRTEARRQESSSALEPKLRAKLGQYFTPAPAAEFIASLARLEAADTIRILDPGAGAGSLTASLVMRILHDLPGTRISVTACEVDPQLHGTLAATLEDCVTTSRAAGSRLEVNLVRDDFIAWATEDDELAREARGQFDLVIMNPPYRKLAANSRERRVVAAVCTETSNLYSAFMALGVHLLAPGGQLIAITPRSFANGPYFRPFRRYFLDHMHIDHVHVFEARNKVFADTYVLQENVIFSATRTDSRHRGPVTVSSSQSFSSEIRSRTVCYEEMVHPADPEHFIHISADEEDVELAAAHANLPATLSEINCQVSTGRVVDFRSKEHLRPDPAEGAVPLIYPLHMREGGICWPVPGAKKNNAIMLNGATEKMTFPAGYYVVVKRLSSKEEKRRVVASVFDPDETPCERIGFENHVNVFHDGGEGITKEVARGLCLWLNSTLLDRFIRRFSGHTQVNATDLRNLRYPSKSQLSAIGRDWSQGALPDQEKIDDLVERHLEQAESDQPLKR
ncbi:Eco57I restriction-modification methylase domain-containing protein [Streptomyces sp. NRRL S-920]|uniref:Eco57I restriction-modification methylase domain-containing protein n=1 Tax=Streptomyces sp. NRRL S-920 TaxID=1463921 RepID=UPI0004C89CFC|nr:Eco57I restriction-modification methylase domain-containing protein [Streptomyces sp. NRRL S-920]